MAKHDENRDLRSFGRIGKINPVEKTLSAPKSAIIGIHLWGRIDYLTKYCCWHFIWDNTVFSTNYADKTLETKEHSREIKKVKKEQKLTDKTKNRK